MTTAIAKKDVTLPPELMGSFEEEAGAGMENVDMDSLARPALSVLQSMSPQVKKSEPEFIKGSEEGDIFKGDTQEVFKGEEGVLFIPVHYKRHYIEWRTRESGGGFVAEYASSDPIVKDVEWSDDNKPLLPNGNILQDTRDHYGLLLSESGAADPVIISMTSTQIKVSKAWMSSLRGVKMQGKNGMFSPPSYANVYRLTTTPVSNDKGSWYVWKPAHEGFVQNADIAKAAKDFHDLIEQGNVTVAREQEGEASSGSDDDDSPF